MKEIVVFSLFFTVLVMLIVLSFAHKPEEQFKYGSSESWICKNKKCQKATTADDAGSSLETCNMLCYDSPPLWPKPKILEVLKKNSSTFFKEHIFLKIHAPTEVKLELEEAANIFLDNLVSSNRSRQYRLHEDDSQLLRLTLHVQENDLKLSFNTNESYSLYSQRFPDSILINIFARNYYGARHGLETLSQLIWFDELSNKFRIMHDVKVIDTPSFRHRGLMIDVSRHYFPTNLLKKAVEGMAASKLNVLHLHISDVTSFPLELPHNKIFSARGAYDDESMYSPKDIQKLIKYAKKRGIRTILEIDAPSHINPEAWPNDEIICNHEDIFTTTLNPDNPATLNTLQSIYADLLQLGTDTETFHIGNDEVVTDCWQDTDAARKENHDMFSVWAKFSNEMMERIKVANNNTLPSNIVLWSSPLTDAYIGSLVHQKNLVIQYWFGNYEHILDNNYKIIFSTVGEWYLDCGFGPWKKSQTDGVCDPYTNWRKFYKYRPWKNYSNKINQVMGGEVCLWSEQVSPDDLETRLWPRSAAFAERVWSDPIVFEEDDVFRRIDFHSRRLKKRGLRVAAIWPQVCSLYPDRC